jgi:hypothetical protein
MPFSTKAELRTSIKDWSKRNDLTDAQIDDLIVLTEREFNRVIRHPAMEQRDQAFTISGEYTTLPTGCRELRSILITNSPSHPLKLISPQAADDYFDNQDTGTPLHYMVSGDGGTLSLRVIPAPSSSFNADILYFAAFDALTDAVSNYIFANHPDVYLWGALVQLSPFIADDERIPVWQSKYAAAVKAVIDEGTRLRWSGSQPQMRVRVNP